MKNYNLKIQLNMNRNQKMSLKMNQCRNHLTEYSDLDHREPRVDYREPSEDEFYAVFEIKE